LSAAGVVLFALTYASAQTPRPAAAPPAAAPTAEAAARPVPAGNVEHGRYLAEHVAMCVECHSGRDGQGNILASERYLGAPIPFMPPWPNDWATRAPRNKGLPGYTDAQAQRLLTQGAISRTGLQLKPPMPRFRMTPQDAADITAFLRSLP
jgi:mono/diheme cytochrome c family protein